MCLKNSIFQIEDIQIGKNKYLRTQWSTISLELFRQCFFFRGPGFSTVLWKKSGAESSDELIGHYCFEEIRGVKKISNNLALKWEQIGENRSPKF